MEQEPWQLGGSAARMGTVAMDYNFGEFLRLISKRAFLASAQM